MIFIDEIESLAPVRTGEAANVMSRVVPQLLAELEGVEGEGRWQAGRMWVAGEWPAVESGVSLQSRRDLFVTARCAGLARTRLLRGRTAPEK